MLTVEFCPVCESDSRIAHVTETINIKVRGEEVPVSVNFECCQECGNRWEKPAEDMMDRAFREYRKRHNMLQPEEIKGLRQRYGLTQAELSKFLGFGAVTLSRYENGSLQDEAHDNALRLVTSPENMLEIVSRREGVLPPEKLEGLLNTLRNLISFEFPKTFLELIMQMASASMTSGLQCFNLDKVINSILFFCKDGISITVLNKLLFYMDFKHYKEHGISITGMTYAAINYGPVPDNYDSIYEMIRKDGYISKEIENKGDYSKIVFKSTKPHDESLFTPAEIETMKLVRDRFKGFTAMRITNFSHQEKGFKETARGSSILYSYAKDLRI